MKPRYKRKFFWILISLFSLCFIGIIIIPPLITLNNLRQKIETTLYEQTNIPVKIHGDIHFSLIGRATIVANDLSIPNGTIESVMFSIPIKRIFNLSSVNLNNKIVINNSNLKITKLIPIKSKHTIFINNSKIDFLGKEYTIINGEITNSLFTGQVRTNQHKYKFSINNDYYIITNNTNKLKITGHLYSNGKSTGHLYLETNNINKWFEFTEPKIQFPLQIGMNFEWDGEYGFNFTNITSNKINGDIALFSDGSKNIKLKTNDIDFNLDFILKPTKLFFNTNYNLDMIGSFSFMNKKFKHLKIQATSKKDIINISEIIIDNTKLIGGSIDETGAHNILINTQYNKENFTCLFNGNHTHWECKNFDFANMHGTISVKPSYFYITVNSDLTMPSTKQIQEYVKTIGTNGEISFTFADAAGVLKVINNTITPSYSYIKQKTLKDMKMSLPIIPKYMQEELGDFLWSDNSVSFVPKSNEWQLYIQDNFFYISGQSIKKLLSKYDLYPINDFDYIITGNFNKKNISNLKIILKNNVLHGSITDNNITLKTTSLDLDSFINKQYFNNYDKLSFTKNSALFIPFEFNTHISLFANKLKYNKKDFSNFVYSLTPNLQTYSISDDLNGNLLIDIKKDKSSYNFLITLNKFRIDDKIFSTNMPLNIRDSYITAQANLNTHGFIEHDIWYNLNGDLDISFNDGFFIGLNTDTFYKSGEKLSKLNLDSALTNALTSGTSILKNCHIKAKYTKGNFMTTQPININLSNVSITGNISIIDSKMNSNLKVIMHGLSKQNLPFELKIDPYNKRTFSISDILNKTDFYYLQNFLNNKKG